MRQSATPRFTTREPHQAALIAAAEARGIEWIDLAPLWDYDAVLFRQGEREALVRKGRCYPELTSHAEFICDQKHVTKAVLAELGLPTPVGLLIDDAESQRDEITAFLARVGAAVCKPAAGTHGRGVAFSLTQTDAVVAHCGALQASYRSFVLERQIVGDDLRLQVIGGELYAACVREPASIVGDGTRTVGELASARHEEVQHQSSRNRLLLDGESMSCLAEVGLHLEDVPARGRTVRLKRVPSIGEGGRARDVTETLHPIYRAWCPRISARLGLSIFAIDAIASAPDRPDGVILEINARSEWLHHSFTEGRQHDVAGAVLADLLALSDRRGSSRHDLQPAD
ncbi:MAG: hypothetical protein KC609_22310 [Myxococcales bacterium]|nr:hypothetical protein [Myxococcales bacterium]